MVSKSDLMKDAVTLNVTVPQFFGIRVVRKSLLSKDAVTQN